MDKTTINAKIIKNNKNQFSTAKAYRIKFSALALLAIMSLSLNACETIAGVGRDIENAATAMQGAGQNADK